MAIAALVCGIAGLTVCMPVGVVGLVGMILGIVATLRAGREPDRYGGKGLAIGGICTGAASLLLTVVMIPLMVAILLPSLARAREITKRAVDASNLRGIGQAVLVYANDNQDMFPLSLQVLIDDRLIVPKQLVNPSSGHAPPTCDYYYVTGLTSEDRPDWIIAYSDPQYHAGEGANILYLDGHVSFEKEPTFTQQIDGFKAAYQKSRGKPPVVISPGTITPPPGYNQQQSTRR
jgi:prepilin-type processing-associated H-X9-DG protein